MSYQSKSFLAALLGGCAILAAAAERSVEAKDAIQEGHASVNGKTETRRGRKLYAGDTVSFDGREIKIQ